MSASDLFKARAAAIPANPQPTITIRFRRWHIQEQAFGGLDSKTAKHLDGLARGDRSRADRPRRLKPGTVLLREYQGERHTVTVVAKGYVWPLWPLPHAWLCKRPKNQLGRLIHVPAKPFAKSREPCERNSRGQFLVKRITRRDRMRATLREIKDELRRRMHQPIPE
jgi:hypothetical protein